MICSAIVIAFPLRTFEALPFVTKRPDRLATDNSCMDHLDKFQPDIDRHDDEPSDVQSNTHYSTMHKLCVVTKLTIATYSSS